MSGRYVMGFDQGRPGGDRSVLVVFDTLKREIVNIQEWTEEYWIRVEKAKNTILNAQLEAIADQYRRAPGHNPSGVDDQGEAVIVDPPALPDPGATKAGA